jgi:sugar lactone lactonase YvrE
MRKVIATILLIAGAVHTGCAASGRGSAALPRWSFEPEMIFPADRSLKRPEDGVFLNDGRIVVADQVDGLRVVSADGSSRPFGKLAQAGYAHDPPSIVGAPNGVALEPAGTHILVADVYRGGIYSVEIATEATERVYQHPFGVNTARRDRAGGLWFTQSTRNRPEHGEEELFRSVDVATPDGALYYLPPSSGGEPRAPVLMLDGLLFANGFEIDETNVYLYLAETTGGRVTRYNLDTSGGRVWDRTVVLEVDHPDNLELHRQNRLWIASPVRCEIIVMDLATGATQSVLRISTPKSEQRIEAIEARIANGTSWIELLTPELWEPGPGMTTGIILPPDDGPVYVTGLGDALIRLKP